MKKPVLLFYRSASVCKLTTVLADISMQNSFSSFGPKMPLAGDTTMEQEAAWLPMSCQTERTFSSCWSSHTVSPKNTKLFSGLGHFQAATPTVCQDWFYNSPWEIRSSCLHWLQVTSSAQLRLLGWEQSHCNSSHILKPFQAEANLSDIRADVPHLSPLQRLGRDNPGVGTFPKRPAWNVPRASTHWFTHQQNRWVKMLYIFLLGPRCSKGFSCRLYTMDILC